MASFPGSIYSPTSPVSSNPRTSPSLAGEVAGANGEIVAIETALGTNLSNIAVFPSGVIMMYAGTVAPTGWLFCQGQAVSRATYAGLNSLASAAGYASPWGAGNGTTTFNVPQLTGLVPVGSGTGFALGATGGATTASGVINHTHAATDSGHQHESPGGGNFVETQVSAVIGSGSAYGTTASANLTRSGTASITTANPSGGVSSISLYQPYLVIGYIIKT